MGLSLVHVGKRTHTVGPFMGYPHTSIGGGHTVAWTGTIIIVTGPISHCCAFIFDNHVLHDNTCVHDISDAVHMPQPRWTFQYRSSTLEHTKCPLHILVRCLLTTRKVFLPIFCCASDRLHEDGPHRIDLIRQIVAHVVLVAVGDETDSRTNTKFLVVEKGRRL